MDLLGYDLLMAATVRAPVDPDAVAVVGIDDDDTISSTQLREEVADIPRVMRRDYLAKVLESILDAGAAGIGLDIVLSSSVYKTCDKEADRRLKGVLRKARMLGRPVVLGFYPASPGKKPEFPHDYFLLSADRVGFLDFDGDIVFVGYTFRVEDEHTIPVSSNIVSGQNRPADRIHGIYIHALGAKTLLSGKLLRDVPAWAAWTPAAVLALASGILFLLLPPVRAGAVLASLALFACLGVYALFSSFWVMQAAPLTFGLLIPGAVTGTYRYGVQYRQFRYVQRFFKSYVNPYVLQQILDDPKSAFFEGRRVTVSVMFADIRNFSTLSEALDPQQVVSGLNRYLAQMTEAVVRVNGYMNRFVGDGILAIFGAPNPLPDDGALSAVECGLEMLERLRRLNVSEIFPGIAEIRIGIGVHTGEAVVGNIGCYQKMDYAITGDTPNLASRIEGMTKVYQVPFLISGATYERVKDRIEARFIDTTQVKGRKEAVNLYEVISLKAGD